MWSCLQWVVLAAGSVSSYIVPSWLLSSENLPVGTVYTGISLEIYCHIWERRVCACVCHKHPSAALLLYSWGNTLTLFKQVKTCEWKIWGECAKMCHVNNNVNNTFLRKWTNNSWVPVTAKMVQHTYVSQSSIFILNLQLSRYWQYISGLLWCSGMSEGILAPQNAKQWDAF